MVLGVVLGAVPAAARADCIEMDKTKPNGKVWDDTGVCTEPDPYVVVDDHDYEKKACDDTFISRIKTKSGRSFMTVKVFNADVGPDDYARSCTLRRGGSCSTGAGATVSHSSSSCDWGGSGPVASTDGSKNLLASASIVYRVLESPLSKPIEYRVCMHVENIHMGTKMWHSCSTGVGSSVYKAIRFARMVICKKWDRKTGGGVNVGKCVRLEDYMNSRYVQDSAIRTSS